MQRKSIADTAQTTTHLLGPIYLAVVDTGLGLYVLYFSSSRTLSPKQLGEIGSIKLPKEMGVVIAGKGPLWLTSYLAGQVRSSATFLAFYDPRLGGIISEVREAQNIGMIGDCVGKWLVDESIDLAKQSIKEYKRTFPSPIGPLYFESGASWISHLLNR